MPTCTFFGHRDAPTEIELLLSHTLISLIENNNVNMFYVGNHGRFDSMVRKNLKQLKTSYPHINYAVVLAYMPNEKPSPFDKESMNTIFPEGLETVPPKYAIPKRNRWMIDHSDYVITYVKHSFGGAGQFKKLAEKKGKTVLNLADFHL